MALDTYANLQTAIGNFLNRTDLTAAIPDFITLAEAQMRRAFKEALVKGVMLPRKMATQNASFAITAAAEFADQPTDFFGVLSFTIDTDGSTIPQVQLDYIDPQNLAYLKARRGQFAQNDTPGLFTITGSKFQFLPIPDQNYTADLWYWQDFTSLSNSNTSNWILAAHPDAYLYGALLQAAPYLMDDNRIAVWGTGFEKTLDEIIRSDPLPPNRSWMRMDSGLMSPRRNRYGWSITTGEFTFP